MKAPGEVGRPSVPATAIRLATTSDLAAIAAIEQKSFTNPWHPQTFRSLLARDGVRVFVAEAPGDGVVGYSVMWWVMDQGELANLAVRDDWRGKGVGSALLDGVMEDARRSGVQTLFLEVRVSNAPARALYFKRGFTRVGLRKDYYRNPREDADILCAFLHGLTSSEPL